MILRKLTPADVHEHDKVASQAFCFPCDVNDPTSVLPCDTVWGAFDDDNKTLFADLEVVRRECFLGTGRVSCAAVGGVAAKPEHRGKGAVKALFTQLLQGDDYDISILYPFSEGYYRQFGYQSVGQAVSAEIPFAEFAEIPRNHDAVLWEGDDSEALLNLYNRCAAEHPLCFVRDTVEAFSAEPYQAQRFTYLWHDAAFATFSVNRAEGKIQVAEFYYENREAMIGMLGFLRNFEGNQATLCFDKLPLNTPLLRYLSKQKVCKLTLHNAGSVALLNPAKVLALHRYPAAKGTFTLQINDSFRNRTDSFTVTYEKGKGDVTEGADFPDLVMEAPAAAELLLCGIESARDAALCRGVQVNNADSDFFGAFHVQTPFFTDGF